MEVAPGKGAVTGAEAGVPPVEAVEVPVPIDDTGGGILGEIMPIWYRDSCTYSHHSH